jgi:peptidoglycan/LPS O-acetylase OafA/YrhL
VDYGLYLIHMLVFYWYDDLVGPHCTNLQPTDGKFYLVLIRFVVAGGIGLGLAFLSRRFFQEKSLRLKDRFAC